MTPSIAKRREALNDFFSLRGRERGHPLIRPNTETVSKATLGGNETPERRGGAHMGFPERAHRHTILNNLGYGSGDVWPAPQSAECWAALDDVNKS